MLYRRVASYGENLEIRGPQMHNTVLGKEISRHFRYPMCLELQNKKLLFWKKGQGRDALDGFCNTPKYTLTVLDMFRVFCQRKLNVS